MEKKRIAILAVILFLLIGLGTFVFANPSQEENRLKEEEGSGKVVRDEKEDDDSDTDILETADESEETLVDSDTTTTTGSRTTYRTTGNGNTTTVGNENGGSGQSGIGGTDVDEAYTKALEAVVKAENSLTQNDVDTAKDLVDAVKDATQKQELMDRLEKVQDIIDATALVEQLEKLVNEATNKDDMNGARDYRENSKVEEIVAALTNSDSKTDLTNRLEELAGILNDTDAPKVTTSPAQEVTKHDVTLSVEDDNKVTIVSKLNGQVIENPETYTEEGVYEVTVTDAAFNEKTIKFVIDKTAPTVKVTKSNNDNSTNKDVIVTIEGNEPITIEGWTKVNDTTYTNVYSENGKYSVVVKDVVGNATTINFEVKRIDKVAPTAIITKSNNDNSTNQDVVVTLVSNEAIYKPEGWTEVKTNKEHEFTKTYSKNGKYSVVIKDKAGNETTIKFEVKRIDKVAPKLTVVDPNKYYLEAGEPYVDKGYSAYDEVDKDVTHLVRISYQFQAEGTSDWTTPDTLDTTKLGTYRINYTAYDKAGNTAKGSRVVVIRDTTKPKFIGLEEGGIYNPATIQVEDATLKTISVYSENDKTVTNVENGYVIIQAGRYTITAVDQKGNTETITITVDTSVPTYTFNAGTVEYNNVYGTLNLKLHDENGIASVVINGTQLPHTGYYVDINDGHAYTFQNGVNTVVVTDNLGNTATYTFNVDKEAPTYVISAGSIENNGAYEKLNLQLRDPNGIASVMINGTQLPHTGNYVDINDGHAYTFQNGLNKVFVKDSLGNSTTYEFNVIK